MTTSKVNPAGMSRKLRARAGLTAIAGYGLSMILLAVVSLIAIPSMVSASGAVVWGFTAAGQSIGGIAAVVIAYGWGLSGPASIARADAQTRATEYVESAQAKAVLFVPIGGLAFLVALLVGRQYGLFAAMGALSMATVGLTANWYFVGASQPYRLLLLETVPRVAGTLIGIAFMHTGSSALIGSLWQLIGTAFACLMSTVWIVKPWRWRAMRALRPRPLAAVLSLQRQGVTSTILSSVYNASPIIIVALVAPAAQPVYAVVDKVQRQMIVALGPFVTFLQGWVPRSSGTELLRRVRSGILATAVFSLLLGVGMLIVAPRLVDWLGGRQIHPPFVTLWLMAAILAVSLFESVTSKAALAALARLDVVAKATAIGTLVGLPLVAVGAILFGAAGALVAILAGLIVRVTLELVGVRRSVAEHRIVWETRGDVPRPTSQTDPVPGSAGM